MNTIPLAYMSDANSPGPLATAEAAPVGASAAVASVAAGSLRARAGDVADLAAAVALGAGAAAERTVAARAAAAAAVCVFGALAGLAMGAEKNLSKRCCPPADGDGGKDTHDVTLLAALVAGLRLGLCSAVLGDVALEAAVVAGVENEDTGARCWSKEAHQVGVPALGQFAAWWPTVEMMSAGWGARRARGLTAATVEASTGRHGTFWI